MSPTHIWGQDEERSKYTEYLLFSMDPATTPEREECMLKHTEEVQGLSCPWSTKKGQSVWGFSLGLDIHRNNPNGPQKNLDTNWCLLRAPWKAGVIFTSTPFVNWDHWWPMNLVKTRRKPRALVRRHHHSPGMDPEGKQDSQNKSRLLETRTVVPQACLWNTGALCFLA